MWTLSPLPTSTAAAPSVADRRPSPWSTAALIAAAAFVAPLPAVAAEVAGRVCGLPVDEGVTPGLWVAALVVGTVGAAWSGHQAPPVDHRAPVDSDTVAKCLLFPGDDEHLWEGIAAPLLEVDDEVLCEAGDVVPCDGEVITGTAPVAVSDADGRSVPGGLVSAAARSKVAAGTSVVADWIVVRVVAPVGGRRSHG